MTCPLGHDKDDGQPCGVCAEAWQKHVAAYPMSHVLPSPPSVTRFEVIDHTGRPPVDGRNVGRILSMRGVNVELSFQDNERTLKVFVTEQKKDT